MTATRLVLDDGGELPHKVLVEVEKAGEEATALRAVNEGWAEGSLGTGSGRA